MLEYNKNSSDSYGKSIQFNSSYENNNEYMINGKGTFKESIRPNTDRNLESSSSRLRNDYKYVTRVERRSQYQWDNKLDWYDAYLKYYCVSKIYLILKKSFYNFLY